MNGNTVLGQLEAFRVPDCNEFFYFALDPLSVAAAAATAALVAAGGVRAPFERGGKGDGGVSVSAPSGSNNIKQVKSVDADVVGEDLGFGAHTLRVYGLKLLAVEGRWTPRALARASDFAW